MKKKAQYYVREYYDRPVSKKEFIQKRGQEIERSCVRQKYLLDTKLFSFRKIKFYQKQGILVPIRHRKEKYFKKDEIVALLEKDNKTTNRARQLGLFEK